MKKRTDTLHPPKLGRFLLIAGLVIFVTFSAVRGFYFNLDPMSWSDNEAKLEWLLRLGREIGFVTAISTMIIFGIRAIRFYGRNAYRYAMPIAGISICVIASIFGFYSIDRYTELESVLDDSTILEKTRQVMSQEKLTAQERSKVSKSYASTYYLEHGKQIKYLTPTGTSVLFEPPKEIKEMRSNKVRIRYFIAWGKQSLTSSIYFWFIMMALSLLLGFLTPVRETNS